MYVPNSYVTMNRIFTEIYRGNLKGVETCLNEGYFEEYKESAKTLIHDAVSNGRYEICELLISCGVDLNERDAFGDTPLLIACEHEYTGIAEMLLKNKADPNLKNSGTPPLEKAVARGDKDTVELLLEYSANVNYSKFTWTSLLQFAIYGNETDIIRILLEAKVDVNEVSQCGTALHVAADQGNKDVIDILVEAKADINKTDHRGRTPILTAVESGHRVLVTTMINHHADINIRDDLGKSLADYLLKFNDNSIEELQRKFFEDEEKDIQMCREERKTSEPPAGMSVTAVSDRPRTETEIAFDEFYRQMNNKKLQLR